jgi:hypothetical protein
MEVINHWPAFNMYGQPLAQFTDANLDGQYDPADGDVPFIRGDQAIYFVFNDSRGAHGETGGAALGVEIQGMAYAYNCTTDMALYNTIFTHYKIINKSAISKDSVFIGNWTDFDIGWYNDDYIGSDVSRGAYYGYNATQIDGSGQLSAYGANPPAEAVVFLKGPLADTNGLDDPQGMLPNETNCGDGITDNEHLGMSTFMCFNNNTDSVSGNPAVAGDYYNFLTGSWKNGAHWTYGGDGIGGATDCNFIYPGNSDPYGYGVGGTMTSPVSMPAWDEVSANNTPADRRGMASCGPFTLVAGAAQELDLAYVYGRATSGGNLASVTVMKNYVDSIRQKFNSAPNNIIAACGCTATTGTRELKQAESFVIYPNPATENITIDYKSVTKNINIEIYDVTGRLVKRSSFNTETIHIVSVKELTDGLYMIKIQDGPISRSQKFLKK